MNRNVKFALVLFFILAVLVVGWFFVKPLFDESFIENTSDAQNVNETIRIAGDNYLGYWFVTSPEMRQQCLAQGIRVDFTDDGGAYAERLEKFENGEYDAIVLPVNSYLEHGAKFKYPGVIVASVSESKGADGIVGFTDKFPIGKGMNVLLNNPSLKIAYTSGSPSEFLMDLTIADFGLNELRGSKTWRVEVASSRDVYELAKKKNGDAFVLWEPDLSKALSLPGMRYLWGSDKFSGYIIDVFVFSRDFVSKKEQSLQTFFKTYFRVLDIYANNRERLIEEMGESADLSEEQVEKMLEKIEYFNLAENAELQFGISPNGTGSANDGLINTIIACTNVELRTKKFSKDPLEGNPYKIVNSSVIKELIKTGTISAIGSGATTNISFASLDKSGWKQLREVGTMRVEPITFQSWNNLLDETGKNQIDVIATMLVNNYPSYRVVIRGHTGPGDEAENEKLSRERAEAVHQYLITVHGIDINRLRPEGVGSKMPPQKETRESPREYRYRLPRVEFILFEANKL